MSKPTLNRHQVARHLDRVALTSKDRQLAASASDLVSQIDSGAGNIPAKLDSFLATAWMTAARGVAAGSRKVASLREIASLEESLGLAPDTETVTETDSADDTEPDTESDTETDTGSYSSSYTYGEAS